MKLTDILDILKHYQSPADWLRVDNESRDGGNTLVCLEDVLLCMRFNFIWQGNKPLMRLELAYGPTLLSWADIPLRDLSDRPNHETILQTLLSKLQTRA